MRVDKVRLDAIEVVFGLRIDHAEDRMAYANLKSRLAAVHHDDREAYTRGKDAFVAEGMDRARAAAEPEPGTDDG